MQIEKIELQEFLFYEKVPKIEDKKYKYRQKNQLIKYIFLEYRLFTQQQWDFWKKEAEKHKKKKEGVWILSVFLQKEEAKKT